MLDWPFKLYFPNEKKFKYDSNKERLQGNESRREFLRGEGGEF